MPCHPFRDIYFQNEKQAIVFQRHAPIVGVHTQIDVHIEVRGMATLRA